MTLAKQPCAGVAWSKLVNRDHGFLVAAADSSKHYIARDPSVHPFVVPVSDLVPAQLRVSKQDLVPFIFRDAAPTSANSGVVQGSKALLRARTDRQGRRTRKLFFALARSIGWPLLSSSDSTRTDSGNCCSSSPGGVCAVLCAAARKTWHFLQLCRVVPAC